MCGIAGIVGSSDGESALAQVRSMASALARRGPDAEGFHMWPGAVFGHRRLAILDLTSAGAQPMLSDDGQTGVVFNGCIYNFIELREQLRGRGYRFRSECDTEVLIWGYLEWGIDALVRRLRGMFAFGIWDNRLQKLFLVRDRLGVKPLVYAERAGTITFASTLSALRSGCDLPEIDPTAILEFLEFGYVTDDRTICQGASKLAAATILEWSRGKTEKRRYWTMPEADPESKITFDEAVEETERLVLEAVRLRLCADVPIGSLLSGGIDSTLVCWATAKLNADIRAFTVGTPGEAVDETAQTLETARILGISHEVVRLPDRQDGLLDELTDAYGEPFGASSALAMLRVSHAVREYATVLLTGDGGDDVFLGYSFHRDLWRAECVARLLPDGAGRIWRTLRPAIAAVPALRRARNFLNYATGGLGNVARAHDGLPWYHARGMFGERLLGLELVQRLMPESQASARNLLSEFLSYQQKTWFVAEFMTKVDGGAMYHGLEARSPFLDHVLWEFAAKLPVSLRLKGGVLKAVLRAIVGRRVSPAVANRKKQGFTIPVERWLLTRWKAALLNLRESSPLERQGWLRKGSLAASVDNAVREGNVPRQLWFLLVLDHWLRGEENRTPLPVGGFSSTTAT